MSMLSSSDESCQLCQKSFTIIHLKHKCHKCQISVCNQCSKHKWKLNIKEQTQKKRVCDKCYEILSNACPTKQLIDDHHAFQLTSSDFLTDPSKNLINIFLLTFQKCWLRDKYPQYYQQILEEQIQQCLGKKLPKKKKKKRRMLHKSEPGIGRGYDFDANPYDYKTIKKPNQNELIFISAGVLWVNIMNAIGVPDCDSVGKPDPYCKYYVTSNDEYFAQDGTCIYPPKYQTKILHDTFTPEWNEDKSIIITNTTGNLVVELWDNDRMSKDNYLGKIEIPLNALYLHYSCNPKDYQVIDDWFEVTIIDKYKDKIDNKHKPDLENLHSDTFMPIYSKLEAIPNMDAKCNLNIDNKCYIRLQIKLLGSWYGNLISHFDPVLVVTEEIKFDLSVTMSELNKLLIELFPIIDQSNVQIEVLKWIKYEWSMIYVVLFTFFTFYPWFTIFYIQLRILIYICHSYIQLDEKRKKQINVGSTVYYICLCFGNLPKLLDRIMKQHEKNKIESDDQNTNINTETVQKKYVEFDDTQDVKMEEFDEQEQISLGAFTKIVGKSAIKVSGLKGTLGLIQEILILVNKGIEFMKSICKWKDDEIHIANLIVIGLFVMCVLSIIFRETNFLRYELYFIGMSVLTFYSKPVQFCLWIVLGLSYWYNSYYRCWKMYQVENDSAVLPPELVKTSTINEQIMDDLKGMKIKNKVKIKKENCMKRLCNKIRNMFGNKTNKNV